MFYIGNLRQIEEQALKRCTIVLIFLFVTTTATVGSYQAISRSLPIQTIERGSSSRTNGHNPGITLALSQNNITIVRGSPAQLNVRIGLAPSGSFRVTLSAQPIPFGVSVSFSTASARSSFVSTMTIIANNASSLGHFDLTVVASGDGVTKIAPLSILEAALVHDLAVISAIAPATATIGKIVMVNATVANYGSLPESYTLNVYANNTLVATESSTTLIPYAEASTTLSWNTTGFTPGEYALVVAIPPIPGESDLANNHFQPGNILLVQAPTGNPAPPTPQPGSPQPASANWRELAIAVALAWIAVVAFVLFRGSLRRAIRRMRPC
jgi:CARDB protein